MRSISIYKQRQVAEFFDRIADSLIEIGYQWRHFVEHREPLEDLEDVGGLLACPPTPRIKLVLWMVLCYLGEPGGYGTFGRNRQVFNSDTAAPRIRYMFRSAAQIIKEDFEEVKKVVRLKLLLVFSPLLVDWNTLKTLLLVNS